MTRLNSSYWYRHFKQIPLLKIWALMGFTANGINIIHNLIFFNNNLMFFTLNK